MDVGDMPNIQTGQLVNLSWNIADDVLHDLYVRGKYRDVILPVTVLRRLDAVLKPTKDAVLAERTFLDDAGIETRTGRCAWRTAADAGVISR